MINLPTTITQNQAASTTSKNYLMIPTIEVIGQLEKIGLSVLSYSETGTRKPEWQGFQKHRVVMGLDNGNQEGKPTVNIVNASNGTSKLSLSLGYFVKVCSNGMITSLPTLEANIRHTLNHKDYIKTAIDTLLREIPTVEGSVSKMSQKTISVYDQWKMAEYAVGLRFEGRDLPFPVSELLKGYHLEQQDQTVWNVFNRIQANIIRGFSYTRQQGRREVTRKTRSVKSLDLDMTLNKQLWEYAESLA